MIVERMEIVSQQMLATKIFELVLRNKRIVQRAKVGQFLHLKVSEGMDPLLRRPISIANIDKDRNELTVIYRAEGTGTKLLSTRKQGEMIDVLGPLGNGFPVETETDISTAILIGGGIGVPPLYELAKQFVQIGKKVITVIGFSSERDVFYEGKFAALGDVHVSTIDGSAGTKGTVLDVIKEKSLQFDAIYACGPTVMLKAIEETYPTTDGFLSLEERMACGIGACFACVCHKKDDLTGTSYKKVCTDGPVFPIGEVQL
ncbi:MAG: dihydroorotate dehydrogenase electron transfer subunit [Bacillaceae bacterium]|nr:dihydroorotate dehydrogenase electron transfer subunit [Bacillaceae bacterium]